MVFLKDTVSYSTYRRIWRDCFDSLQDLLFQELLLRQTFTTLGAARLMFDFQAIQSVIVSASKGAEPALTMRKLLDGINLLNLPLEAEEGEMSLKTAYVDMFETNGQAGVVLERLGITKLTVLESRKILQNRLEAQD